MKNSEAIASSYSDSEAPTSVIDEAWDIVSRREGDEHRSVKKTSEAFSVNQSIVEEPIYPESDYALWPLTAEEGIGEGLIRIKKGLHERAEHVCQCQDMVMIGSGTDCDLVLADPQVARHHCLVVFGRDGYSVRALDAPVELPDQTIAPGEQITISTGVTLALADVSLELVAEIGAQTKASVKARWVVWLAVVIAVFTLMAGQRFLAPYLSSNHALSAAGAKDELKMIESLPAPSMGSPNTEKRVNKLADQVSEILRLSGISAQATELGAGRVEVTGVFADSRKLENAIHSRAMQDIDGLQQVVVRNQLEPEIQQPTFTDDKEIARVITGSDPYVVTRDNARYYPGAELKDGRHIDQIKPEGVVVTTVEGGKKLLEPGTLLY
ncbi:SctD/MshK family protein [Hahella ganghwensis]|uniref:SctD/MshK family protein n=1 Tax=Hahella ganghwensis TaxID=286420 RepID=UPI000368D15A|nr:FHA domain-containing protein [Hahella ganghwensis]